MNPSSAREELPPGWKRVESRTKPGTYYYAHPATNRTQVTPPQGAKASTQNGGRKPAEQSAAPKEMSGEGTQKKAHVEEKEERKRKHQQVEEEAEAEQEMVEEELRRIKAAKKAKEQELKRKKEEELRLEQLRKEEEARLEKERLQREEEERKRRQELEALAEERRKREAEARKKDQEALRRKAMVFEQHSVLQRKLAEEARKRQAEEEEEKRKKAAEEKLQEQNKEPAKEKPKEPPKEEEEEEDEETRKAKVAKREAKVWNQHIPEPSDPVVEPCFDVYKNGKFLRTHRLTGEKTSWTIGRGPAGVDIAVGNVRVSRKHAEISCQTPLMFLTDLGSTYGSAMNGENLEKNQPVELVDGARFRFGGLPELYVFREPPAAEEGEAEEPSSPPVVAEVSGMATAEDGPDLLPQVSQTESAPAPVIDPEAAAAASAAARAAAEAEDEARVRRIQQKRQERKAAQEAEKAVATAKKEEEKKKKQERIQKKRAAKEAKAAKKAARAAAAQSAAVAGSNLLNLGDATPPDATLPDGAMASPPENSPPASPKLDKEGAGADQTPEDDEAAEERGEKAVDFF